MIGKTLSHYTVLEELHKGELQIVYRARDDKLGREVALKILPPELVAEAGKRQRFVQEARDAASLEHPHIGVIHDIDEADGVLFIAMELLGQESLADRLEGEPLTVTDGLDVAQGIAQGLSYAHDHGIVHRDLKPANVMLTRGGYPKLIDFGLAKLLNAEQNPFLSEARLQDPNQRVTSESVIAGTVSYMSPEQARGGTVDPRSDIFSFGVLLYQILSGTPPFEGLSRIDTLYSILRDETPKLAGLSSEERQLLQPLVDRCLEKDPDQRYQSMAELIDDLKRARLRLETPKRTTIKRVAQVVSLTAIIAVAAAGYRMLTSAPPVATSSKPSLAVLHFDNLADDPELDWLRTGLTDMLVTDLSQSPELEVLGTDRLGQILDDMGGDPRVSLRADAVSELARRASVESVLRGSFAKAGDSIRISARLEDAETGKVILSEKAEGAGQESVFRLVDEISGRIKANFSVAALEGELDRDLRDVTTASVEAYRSYAEGIRLHERFREEEAVPHFQKAIELDPGFAMALAKLGVVHSNLGMNDQADAYAEEALQHLDRLSERERHYIEGWYLSRKPETQERAIEAYRKAIERYPDHGSARHNLGNLFVALENYDAAIEQLEELRARGMPFPATYENLAAAYRARGDLGRAEAVLEEFGARNPDDWTTLVSLAKLRIEGGDIEAGLSELDRAESLGASSIRIVPVRWEAHILNEDWDDAMEVSLALSEGDAPLEKFIGGRLAGVTSIYRGRYRGLLDELETFSSSAPSSQSVQPLVFKARLLLELGEPARARDTSLAIVDEHDPYGGNLQAMVIAGIASAQLGDDDAASAMAARFSERATATASGQPDLLRFHQLMQGELARAQGDYDLALSHLYEAESMLPPRGEEGIHTVIWYALATAHREAGNVGEAVRWYERIVDATSERVHEPFPYVRSFYFLGKLYDQEGREEEANESYERFLDHWEDGELDRDKVREVEARVD